VFCEKVTDGDSPAKSSTVFDSLRRSSSADRTLTARGSDCNSCSPVFDAVTTILSATRTTSLKATLTVAPLESRTRCSAGANPSGPTRRRYSPSGRSANANLPSTSVVAVRLTGPARLTAAFAILPPVGSSTEPAIRPV
jgi:hypothetical protein